MPLVPARHLIEDARTNGYALGYFESWDIASLQGVIDAAEQSRAPVILGFNGEFLSHAERMASERLELYAALGRAAAMSANVPCALIFNECPIDAWTLRAIELGFTIVMPVAGARSEPEYTAAVKHIATRAHEAGIAVEAELGVLPHGPTSAPGTTTDPDSAARFVRQTGIDLLAVSVGNVHIASRDAPSLDLDRLDAIHRAAQIPLVLHGGTGVDEAGVRAAIARGVTKINYGTYLKRAYLAALQAAQPSEPFHDPHESLGRGGDHDLLMVCRNAVREAVLARISWLGCCGRA